MKVVLDIDDTICVCTPEWFKMTEEYMASKGFVRKRKKDSYDMARSFKMTERDRRAYWDYMMSNFNYLGLPPVDGAEEFIKGLISAGHTVELLTARPTSKYSETRKWVEEKLDIRDIPINHKVYLEGIQMDLLIDNSEQRVKSALERGIDAILFTEIAVDRMEPSCIKQLKKAKSFIEVKNLMQKESA